MASQQALMAPCERSELLMVSVQVFGMTSSASSAEAASSSTLCRSRSWLWSVGPSGAQPRPATLSRQERAGLETFKIKPEAIISGISFLAPVECFMWIIERLSRCPDFTVCCCTDVLISICTSSAVFWDADVCTCFFVLTPCWRA